MASISQNLTNSTRPKYSTLAIQRLPWRNWLARSTVNRKVGGSSPPGSGVLRVTGGAKRKDNMLQYCYHGDIEYWLGDIEYQPGTLSRLQEVFEIEPRNKTIRSRVGLNHQPFD